MMVVPVDRDIGLNNILFTVTLTYYAIDIHTIFIGFEVSVEPMYFVSV